MIRIFFLLLISAWALVASAQPIPLGEVIFINNSTIKEGVSPGAFEAFFTSDEITAPGRKTPGTFIKLYKADRGEKNGEYLLTLSAITKAARKTLGTSGSPFTDNEFDPGGSFKSRPSDYLTTPGAFTEYELLRNGPAWPMPPVELLGIHYLKVKKEKSQEFERFVTEKLNPSVNRILIPDMGLFYFKAVSGENQGSYITIFAIMSVAAREKFWPEGKPETEELKAAFKSLNDLARELGTYLEEDSYLKPDSGGAAAYFESLQWTDYVMVK